MNDDCVDVAVVRGTGIPMIGTDGNLLDHQTFQRHPDIVPGTVTAASITEGVLHADGLDMALELQVLDEFLAFHVTGGRVHIEYDPLGLGTTGYFSGGISVDQILAEFDLDDIGVADLIADVIPAAADLYNAETGECDAISMTFAFEALPAHLFDAAQSP
jgi:hypothetical protein